MQAQRLTALLAALVAGLLLMACSGQDADDAGPPPGEEVATSASVAPSTSTTATASQLPSAIRCNTQYRPDASTLEGSESPTLVVDRSDGVVATEVTHQFATMTLYASYLGEGPEGRVVHLSVATADGVPLWGAIWQFHGIEGEELQADFGGLGFTGLHGISYEGSSLQVSCEDG